ncbi:MAG: hypothetical protein WKF30_08685 [Pyrinomonadaceae bacterium]
MPSDTPRRTSPILFGLAVYIAVFAAALGAAAFVSRGAMADAGSAPSADAAMAADDNTKKPYFSLSTNRIYGTYDRARVWINYQKVDHLDFRVYRVKDPVKFFKNLDDPHQIGEDEKAEVSVDYKRQPSLLEKLRSFKRTLYLSIKDYFRSQLKRTRAPPLIKNFAAKVSACR